MSTRLAKSFIPSYLLLIIVACGIFFHIFLSNVIKESTRTIISDVEYIKEYTISTISGVAITTKNEQKATQPTQKCDETILPLIASSSSPRSNSMEFKECWPKIFFLPSFPTNGDGMIQTMFMRLTRLHRTSVYKEEGGKPFIEWETKRNEPIRKKNEPIKTKEKPFKIYYNDIHDPVVPHPIIPYGDYPTLTKTHLSMVTHGLKKNGTMSGFTSGIVRIVRNPGDQLLRNQFRFSNCDKKLVSPSTKEEECFANVRKYCGGQGLLRQPLSMWLHFHKFWIDKSDSSIPQMVVYYEKVTSSDIAVASKELRGLLEFVGATYTTGDENKGDSFEKTVGDYIRPPEYEQGTLFAKICGVEKARKLHKATQEITEKNGYSFDHDTGYWSVRNDAVGAI